MVIRLLLITNGILLGVVGLISFLYVERPAGLVGAGVVWVVAATLFGCVHLTDFYRHEG
jgi:hypothetical protein